MLHWQTVLSTQLKKSQALKSVNHVEKIIPPMVNLELNAALVGIIYNHFALY